MKNKLLLLLLSSLLLCSCGKNKYLVAIKLHHAGSVIFWDKTGETYKFEGGGYSEVTKDSYIRWEEFIYDESGTTFNLIKDNEIIDSTTMVAVSSLNQEIYEFNLDNVNKIINIKSHMDNVYIYSNDSSVVRDVTIAIEPRTNPLNIKFKDVNIKPSSFIPAIYSFSEVDINLNFEGYNVIEAGECNLTYGDASYFDTLIEDSREYMYYGWLEDYANIIETAVEADDYYSFMMDVSSELVNITQEGLDYVENLIFGSSGNKGFDGHAAISAVDGLSIIGLGNVQIIGGKGARGSNAIGGIYGNNGGAGGNGGPGIIARTTAITNLDCEICGGIPGEGGLKNSGIIGYDEDARDGKNGNIGKEVSSKYYFTLRY